jgi:antitoxin VapB
MSRRSVTGGREAICIYIVAFTHMLYCKYGAMSMPLNIRDPRAAELAKELAARRKITMTAAIIEALQNEIKRERDKVPLRERLARIALTTRALAGRKGRPVPRSEIDDMWSR